MEILILKSAIIIVDAKNTMSISQGSTIKVSKSLGNHLIKNQLAEAIKKILIAEPKAEKQKQENSLLETVIEDAK